ncbi:MAG: T9SS type A sorting domain-containing protein [Ignavibacteria bacterium]|nr:T9SS type A sorting domain-containing protein [Ignavibacteria bacterium]
MKFLKFNNSTTGYYQSGNKIFKSTNKGVTWSQFADLNNSTFQANDVKEISDSLKLILSYSSVFKSTDGGSSWSFYPFKEIYNYILGFTFIDNNIYSVTGSLNHSLFYKSTNYGETYSYLSGVYTSALHFQEGEDGNLYFYSNGPNLYGIVKSTNEGQTWSTIYQYANNQYISKVKVVNDSTFAISYDIDDVKITTNKGLTWKTFYFPSYYDALFFDKNNNFTAISENFIIKFNSGTPTNIYTESESVSGYELFQNYPNPFNPSTKIKFNLKSNEYVSLKIYDISGKVVFNLINNIFHNAGVHEYEYNATNLSSGIYFYKLETDNFSSVKKMMLIK